jgi:hypothetical protein
VSIIKRGLGRADNGESDEQTVWNEVTTDEKRAHPDRNAGDSTTARKEGAERSGEGTRKSEADTDTPVAEEVTLSGRV